MFKSSCGPKAPYINNLMVDVSILCYFYAKASKLWMSKWTFQCCGAKAPDSAKCLKVNVMALKPHTM